MCIRDRFSTFAMPCWQLLRWLLLVSVVTGSAGVRLRRMHNLPYPRVVGFYSTEQDAVDLSSFPTDAPYSRGVDWNHMLMQTRGVHHRVGQIFKHKRHGYHAAIVSIDPRPTAASDQWFARMGTHTLPAGTQQPFYWCLVHEGDRKPPMMAYVAQDDVAPAEPATALQFAHPDAKVFFDRPKPERLHGKDEHGYMRGVAQGAHLGFKVGYAVEVRLPGQSAWLRATVAAPVTLQAEEVVVSVALETDQSTLLDVLARDVREVTQYAPQDEIEGQWKKRGVWYAGKIVSAFKNGSFAILFDDGDTDMLTRSFLRLHGPAERARRAEATDFFDGAPSNGFRT
eukprot:TRINITY_DN19492_c0_g1_i1.p1 TRINITY_DN19492_c0_g1~~TRINITY_DN19492_c0_g1_i1.p1  ORF type:complete len:340 (+),score=53.81 TRINITY_DN19492_c0_g1_i1:153-1172(+)